MPGEPTVSFTVDNRKFKLLDETINGKPSQDKKPQGKVETVTMRYREEEHLLQFEDWQQHKGKYLQQNSEAQRELAQTLQDLDKSKDMLAQTIQELAQMTNEVAKTERRLEVATRATKEVETIERRLEGAKGQLKEAKGQLKEVLAEVQSVAVGAELESVKAVHWTSMSPVFLGGGVTALAECLKNILYSEQT